MAKKATTAEVNPPEAEEAGAAGSETKEARFKRLAEQRVPATLKKIANIAKLGASSYGYDQEQAAKVIEALKSAVAATEAQLLKRFSGGKSGFTV